MTKNLAVWLPLFLTLCHAILASDFEKNGKTIEKRDCTNSGCNTCDGNNCNICNNNVCCSSASCNQCVNQCSNNCNTLSCRQNCVTGCSSSCQTQSCQVNSCSQCVNRCSNQCSSNQCTNNCANQCNQQCQQPEKIQEPIIIEPPQPSNVIVNNTNNNVVNLTTHVNIHNIVNNYNNISVPIYVNTTNINNINITDSDVRSEPIVVRNDTVVIRPDPQPWPYPIPFPLPQPIQEQDNCCYVMHPRTCYTDDNGDRRCYIRRHRECSNTCTSPVVTIQEPEDHRQYGCHYIRNYPYVYCGNYEKQNCGSCYSCGGNYNPSECYWQQGCSNTCKRSIPNCVPSQSGLQCY